MNSKIFVPSNSPNRLGWIRNIEWIANNDLVDVSSHYAREFISVTSSVDINLSLTAIQAPALLDLLKGWMQDGIRAPSFQQEYMCLYCGSPNSIEYTHCVKCGAPRSFIIG